MKNRVDPYREWKIEFITDIFNISFNFEWTELFVIEFVTRLCRFDISL
jgi:hypothetical protein